MASEKLDALGCTYRVHDIEKHTEAALEMRRLSGQTRVPTLSVSGKILADFGPEELEPFLRAHGILS
jgi:glutaredoxin